MDYEALRQNMLDIDSQTWDEMKILARDGDAEAQFLLGYRLYDTRLECDDCEKWLRQAAAQEHPEAVYHLARTTFHPQVMTVTCPETVEGLRLLTKAAELGFVEAQRDLAVCYYWGEPPFVRDLSKTRYWYLQAAKPGHLESQIAVGSMLVQGDGGPANPAEGLAFLEMAANGPDPEEARAAAELLAHFYSGECGVSRDLEKIKEWSERAKRSS